jgi:hypothetical protein
MDRAGLDEAGDPEMGGPEAVRLRLRLLRMGLEQLREAALDELILALATERSRRLRRRWRLRR